jgi:preprotein translocase subunit SecF
MRKVDFDLNFMAVRKPLGLASLIMVIAAVLLLVTRGLNLGLDFTGGTLVEVGAPGPVNLGEVRATLSARDFDNAQVQNFGSPSDVLVRVSPREGQEASEVGQQVFNAVSAEMPELKLRRIEFVGPQVGDELRDESGLAMLMALGAMLIYVWFRFSNKFGISTVVALFHDVLFVLGAFSLLQLKVDLTVLAAMLALIGYSLNDSIVVADRIRENFRNTRMDDPVAIINDALNRTFSRTLVTSITTLLVLIALFIFGGEVMRAFSEALILGVVIGTYSSIYVASNVLMAMKVDKEDFMLPEKAQEEIDEMP